MLLVWICSIMIVQLSAFLIVFLFFYDYYVFEVVFNNIYISNDTSYSISKNAIVLFQVNKECA